MVFPYIVIIMRFAGALRSGNKAAGKAMLYPALIRLKVFSNTLRAREKTVSLKTEVTIRRSKTPQDSQRIADLTLPVALNGLPTLFKLRKGQIGPMISGLE